MPSVSLNPPARRAHALVNALLIALGLLGLALAANSLVNTLAAASPGSPERFSVTGSEVRIYDLAGQARLTAGNGTAVVVLVTRGGGDSGQLKVATGEIEGAQTLRVIFPSDRVIYPAMGHDFNTEVQVRDDGTFHEGHDHWSTSGHRVRISSHGSGLDAHADLEIQVPRNQQLKLHLAAGDVNVKNVDGELLLDTGAGDVTGSGTRGKLKVDTGSGDVTLSDAQGELDVDTGSGDVELSGMKGEKAKIDTGSGRIRASDVAVQGLDLDTGSGGVEASGVKTRLLRVDTGSGSVDIGLLAAAEKIGVDTGSGSVTLRVPSSLGADISFETGSGDFHTDLPVQIQQLRDGSYRGKLGDGSARVIVETGSGSLRLMASQTK